MPDLLSRLNAALTGRYRVRRELGYGATATVFLADDLKHERRVALKVLKPELAAIVGSRRFLAEIKTTAGLQHPHILPLFDSGEADGLLYYVMPLVDGETLRDRLLREGPLSVAEALAVIKDVAAALSYAHSHGVVHRDIKPANILLEEGEALVADFGIAVVVSGVDREQLTATRVSVGTPAYMSPEQIGGEKKLDGRSDVYGLGCLLYEVLTGEPPFTGGSVQSVMAQALTNPVPSVRDVRPDVPRSVDHAITRALAKRPSDRFETTRDLYEACAVAPVPLLSHRLYRGFAVASALVVLVAAFFAWRMVRVSSARTLLPEISRLADEGQYLEAYALAERAERWIGEDSTLSFQMLRVSDVLTITSEPDGAEVFVQPFVGSSDVQADSVLVGVTPVVGYRVPRVNHRLVVHREGYAPAERIASSGLAREMARQVDLMEIAREVHVAVELHPSDSVPRSMVVVPGGEYRLTSPDAPAGLSALLDDFFIDRYEVTNEDFKAFVEAGGYTTEEYWVDSRLVSRSDFVDRTGLASPRYWIGQAFPDGRERLPVAGVTWHEAAAYCRSVGQRLPTIYEWEKTARDGRIARRGVVMPWGLMSAAQVSAGRANFNSTGAMPVDAFPFGISPYGAYGMAGNVGEWTANTFGDGRAATGGSWEGPSYLYTEYASAPASFASPSLGFRCAHSDGAGAQGAGSIDLDTRTPEYTPVDEAGFRALLDHYRYDRREPNPRITDTVETASWVRERVWIDGMEGDSVLLYFYAPKTATPPYQTIVYVPGVSVFCCQLVPQELEWSIGPVIQAGRAVLAVVLEGMLERGFAPGSETPAPASVGFRDLMVQHATELRLGMDYIETRDDVDASRLTYVAVSFGAGSRLGFSAVDDRFKAAVYLGGGIDERMKPTLPEADNVNFAPYITVPKLLINGRRDEEHPWLTRGLPLWNLFREPKELVLVEGGGHMVPLEARIPAINDFLDRTLGPVRSR